MIRIGPAVAIIIVALHAVGCAGLGKKLNALNESTDKIRAQVVPDMDKKCLEAATTCAEACKKKNSATSQPTEKVSGDDCKASCKPYQEAKKRRDIFYASANSIHTSINVAIGFLLMGDEDKARQIYAKVIDALQKLYNLASDAGFTIDLKSLL